MMSQKKSQLLSFAHDEEEEAEHVALPKLKMNQSMRPLSLGESEAKRAKASPALSSLSAVSGGSYGSDALDALRKAQNYLPSRSLGAEEAREERMNISSSRDLCAASLREGMELSGDAADTFEQILIDREKKEGKHADEALLLDKKKARPAQKAVSFADIFAPTKRETMREAVGAHVDIDEDWEKEILRRGSSLSSSLAPTQSGGNHTRTDDGENYIEVRDLLETIHTNQFVEKEKVLQLQRQTNRLESELVISQDNERRLEQVLSSGVERLNVIENLSNYVPNLVGMLREKEKEIAVLREELIQLVQSTTERVHQQRRTQQEDMLSRVIQISELVGIGEYRPTRPLHGVDVESFHANDAESELFAIQERQIQLEKNAEDFLRRRWLKLDKENNCEPNQYGSPAGGVLHLSMDEERQVVLFAKQRLDVFYRCCEREKNIFALFMEQELSLSSAPMFESFRALSEKLNNLFMDVDQNLCEPDALFTFSASLRSSQRDVYDAAFISTSLAQLCEVFLAKDALFTITSRLQGLSEPLELQIENDMPWLSAMCEFEKVEMTEKRVSPKIVENIFATLLRQLFSIGLMDFSLPGLARDLCAFCEKTKNLMGFMKERPFSSGILASFVSQCEMHCFAVCKTLPVEEDNIERESHDVGLGHSFMFSQCLRGCLFLSSLLILSPCVESLEATRVVERLFRERFGGMILKLLKSNAKESQFVAILFCALAAKIIEIECSSHTWKKFCIILHDYPFVGHNIAEITDFEPLKTFSGLMAVDKLVAVIEPILRS